MKQIKIILNKPNYKIQTVQNTKFVIINFIKRPTLPFKAERAEIPL